MQIWRMKPDDASSSRSRRPLQQLVPHISPDGKQGAHSYGEEIQRPITPGTSRSSCVTVAVWPTRRSSRISMAVRARSTCRRGRRTASESRSSATRRSPRLKKKRGGGGGGGGTDEPGGSGAALFTRGRTSTAISTTASAMHQAVRQLRRLRVGRAVARKVPSAETRQSPVSPRCPVPDPARPDRAPRTSGAPCSAGGAAGGRFGPARVSSEKQ